MISLRKPKNWKVILFLFPAVSWFLLFKSNLKLCFKLCLEIHPKFSSSLSWIFQFLFFLHISLHYFDAIWFGNSHRYDFPVKAKWMKFFDAEIYWFILSLFPRRSSTLFSLVFVSLLCEAEQNNFPNSIDEFARIRRDIST